MKFGMKCVAGACLGFFATTALAGNIYVCKGAHGVNSYQNTPCATPDKQIRHETYDEALARPGTPPPAARVSYGADPSVGGGRRLDDSRMAPPAPRAPPLPETGGGGLGSSAYQRGQIQGARCVNARGQVYYTATGCGTSTQWVGTRERPWHGDMVEGMPGAVMVGPDQAVDPHTGRVVELEHTMDHVNVYRTTPDAGAAMDADQAVHRHPELHHVQEELQQVLVLRVA